MQIVGFLYLRLEELLQQPLNCRLGDTETSVFIVYFCL